MSHRHERWTLFSNDAFRHEWKVMAVKQLQYVRKDSGMGWTVGTGQLSPVIVVRET